MPAHIYSMVGMWQDSITSNLSALEIQPDYYHAADFTVYAHLQLAQDAAAAKLIEKALATPERGDRPPSMANYTAKASMPARYVLERADWKAAAALPIVPTEFPQADSLTHFTRGFGLARLGDRAGARREIDAMQRLRAAMTKAGDTYWADRTQEQILAVSAWIALSEGSKDQAVTLMRQAADGEDASIKHVAMENRLYPMRELLADLLLEAGRPKDAAAEYARALKQTPNRYRGLFGAARAAEAAGDTAGARAFYARVIELSAHADGVRPELQRARSYVERQ
jgi:tetratricopeptide (TPR) repeat protein